MPQNPTVRAIRQLSTDEIAAFHSAVAEIMKFDRADRLRAIFERNVDEFSCFLEYVLECSCEAPGRIHASQREWLIEIDRLLLNILTAMRTFTDHGEAWLKRTWSSDTNQAQRFKSACAHEYDTHFEYRFLSQLRNYAQHCGLPAGSLTVSSVSTRRRPPPKQLASDSVRIGPHAIGVHFTRDTLLNDFQGWKQVATDLQRKPQKIDVVPIVQRVVHSMRRLHRTLRRLVAPPARRAARTLSVLFRAAQREYPSLEPVILELPRKYRKGTALNIRVHHFPLSEMEALLPEPLAILYECSLPVKEHPHERYTHRGGEENS